MRREKTRIILAMTDSANDDVFSIADAPEAMLTAVRELALAMERSMEEMELYNMGQIFEFAVDHYGGALPDFWRVWKDWHESDEIQPMGDL